MVRSRSAWSYRYGWQYLLENKTGLLDCTWSGFCSITGSWTDFSPHALGGQPFRIPSTLEIYHRKNERANLFNNMIPCFWRETLPDTIDRNLGRDSPPTLQRTTKSLHTGISFYPLNNAKKLKKMTENIKNYFNLLAFYYGFLA